MVKIEFSTLFFKAAALLSVIITIAFIGFIFYTAYPIVSMMGINFFLSSKWNEFEHVYGIFPFIIGTICITALTMIIACPISIFTAIFLAEYAPKNFEMILRPMIELLVGIPSVVYGIFGFFVLRGLFVDYINPAISNTLGFIPIFQDNSANGVGLLLASCVLSIMVLPTITVLTQDTLRSLPREYKEASLSLGSTKWEYIKKIALPASISGITTGILLGLMRAMGETMAIVMLTGNSPHTPTTIFDTMYAMTSKILNEMGENFSEDEPLRALFAIAAVLFLMEITIVYITRIISRRAKKV